MLLNINTHYYPFGSPMPSRAFSASSYRYGFNGQEKDDEVAGSGNSNTAEYWQYDTRLGRRWNLDPEPQIHISDYATFGNNPIIYSDILGNKFDKKGEKLVKKAEQKIKERQNELDNEANEFKTAISNIENKISNENDPTKLDELNISKSELESQLDRNREFAKELAPALT